MSSISSLLNLGNTDYYESIWRNKNAGQNVAGDEATQNEQQAQDTLQEASAAQQAARKLYQIEQKIEKLSLSQAQLVMQMLNDKISNSTARYLSEMQNPTNRGLLAPAYI